MPSSTTPPTGIDTLASSGEAIGVAMLAATDVDRISTTIGTLVDAACTTANALVVAGRNGGGTTKVPPLVAPPMVNGHKKHQRESGVVKGIP